MKRPQSHTTLTTDQKHTLLYVVNEQFGSRLKFDEFAEAVFALFENIAGFETIPRQSANRCVNQLWRKYHGQQKGPRKEAPNPVEKPEPKKINLD